MSLFRFRSEQDRFVIVPRNAGHTAALSVLSLLGPLPNWVSMYNAPDVWGIIAVGVAVVSQGVAIDETSRLAGDPIRSRPVRGVIAGVVAGTTGMLSSMFTTEGIDAARPGGLLLAAIGAGTVALLGVRRTHEVTSPYEELTGKAARLQGPHLEGVASFSYMDEIAGRPAKITVDYLDSATGRTLAAHDAATPPKIDFFNLPGSQISTPPHL